MVSAVFHSPGDAAAPAAPSTAPVSINRPAVGVAAEPPQTAPRRTTHDWRALALRVLPPVLGMALLIGLWGIATMKGGSFPTPAATFDAAPLAQPEAVATAAPTATTAIHIATATITIATIAIAVAIATAAVAAAQLAAAVVVAVANTRTAAASAFAARSAERSTRSRPAQR